MLAGLRLLVVGDPDQAELYAVAFEGVGAEAFTVESVSAAKAVLERERFDAVVSDILLPDETGYDLARWLRTTPAVALTGVAAEPERSIEAGFDDHRVKPFPLDELFAVVEQLVGRRRDEGPG